MIVMSVLWSELKRILSGSVPLLAQVVLIYVIVRFAVAVASTITQLAAVPPPKPMPVGPKPSDPSQAQDLPQEAALDAEAPGRPVGSLPPASPSEEQS